MTELYFQLIKAKKRTINEVLDKFKASVLARLAEQGLDGFGNQI